MKAKTSGALIALLGISCAAATGVRFSAKSLYLLCLTNYKRVVGGCRA
jgi:hypothetical protein